MRNCETRTIRLNEKAESARHNIPRRFDLYGRTLKLLCEIAAEQPDGPLSLDVVACCLRR